jgi:hypothetical protein
MVRSIKEISKVIIPHFDKYPLISQKKADYLLFKKIVMIMLQKEHNTLDGLNEIVRIKASLNLGLSDKLRAAFGIIPEEEPRPLVVVETIPNPY